MKFERIEVQNFKPYYRTETLEFDPDSDQPLTLVRGKNDIGKTALLDAIKFCLYGFDVSESQQERTQCINRKAAVDGLGQTSVTLQVRHDGKSYRITRGHHFSQVTEPSDRTARDRFMKVVVSPNTEDEEVFIDTTTEDDEISDGEDFASDLLPKETVRFFMFDGDRIDEFADKLQESNPDVKDAIELILGIREIQYAIQDLDEIAIDHYESEYNDASSEAEDYREKKDERQEVSNVLDELEEKRDELLEEVQETQKERQKVRQKLAEVEDLQETYKRQTRAKAQLYGLDEVPDVEETLDDTIIEDIVENGSVLQQMEQVRHQQQELYTDFGPAAAVVAAKTLENDFPSVSTAIPEAIREVLEARASECLVCGMPREVGVEEHEDEEVEECTHCGRPLEVSRQDLHERLEEVRQDATDQAIRLSETVDNLLGHESEYELSQQAIEQQFESLEEKFSDLESRREKLKARISRFENQLENAMDQTERQSLRDRRDQLDNQLSRLNVQIGETNSDITDKEAELDEINRELNEMEGATEREIHYKTLLDTSEETKGVYEETKDRFVAQQRGQVETEASELFMDMTNKDEVYNGLDIDRDYRLRIEVNGEVRDISEQDPSQGARQIIAYAFNAGIARSTDREAPFVIDTPTGRLDADHKDELLKKLPEFGDQVVVLFQPRELTEEDFKQFREIDVIQNHSEITRGNVPQVSTINRIPDEDSGVSN